MQKTQNHSKVCKVEMQEEKPVQRHKCDACRLCFGTMQGLGGCEVCCRVTKVAVRGSNSNTINHCTAMKAKCKKNSLKERNAREAIALNNNLSATTIIVILMPDRRKVIEDALCIKNTPIQKRLSSLNFSKAQSENAWQHNEHVKEMQAQCVKNI